jgi:hypothetical protein
LGAIEYGSEPGDPYSEIIPDISELPSSVTISYSNIDDDFNGDNEIKNYPSATHYNPKTISTQLNLTSGEAKWFVWKYMTLAWAQSTRYTVNLLPEDAINLREGYRLGMPLSDGGGIIPFQIASIVLGANLIGEIELYQFDGQVFTANPTVNQQTNFINNGGFVQLSPNLVTTPIITSPDGSIIYTEGTDYTVDFFFLLL